MKILKIKLIFILTCLAFTSSAQMHKVRSVEFALSQPGPYDLELQKSDIDEAAEHEKTRNSAMMYYWRGMVYLRLATDYDSLKRKYPDALDVANISFQKAIELDDSRTKQWSKDAKTNMAYVGIGYYGQGYTAYAAGNYDRAIYLLNKSIEIIEKDPDSEIVRGSNLTVNAVLELIGYVAVAKKDDDLARETFEMLVQNGYKDLKVFAALAQLYLIAGDTAKSLETVSDGLRLEPHDKTLINLELDIYLKQGKSKELIDKLNLAIDEDPGNAIYYFARAISYEGLAERIRGDVEKIYKAKRGTPEQEVLDSIGKPLNITTDADGKKWQYKHGTIIISSKTGNVKSVSPKDESLALIDEYLDHAIKDYETIIEIDPNYFDAYYNLGALYQNKVSALIEEMHGKGVYDPAEMAKYDGKIDELYKKAIGYFEFVFEYNTEMSNSDKVELASIMKRIYANIKQMDKFEEMKKWLEENS